MIAAALCLAACEGVVGHAASADDVVRVFCSPVNPTWLEQTHADRIDEFPEFRGAGAPQNDVLYTDLLDADDRVSKGWGPLQLRESFGPEITFARRVSEQLQCPIAIIKSAVGGTTVAFDWNPDAR